MKRFIIFLMIAGVAANVSFAQEREMKIHHFLTVDPKADQYPGVNPYLYCAGNPIKYTDPDGQSTQTDENGKVQKVIDDGDLGVYRYNTETKQYDYMGESLHLLSFANQSAYNNDGTIKAAENMYIDFGSNEFHCKIQQALNSRMSIFEYMKLGAEDGTYDFKAKGNIGSMIDGKYASPQDAGNVLAGAFKASQGILSPMIQYGYGAYNLADNKKEIMCGIIAANVVGGAVLSIAANPLLSLCMTLNVASFISNGEEKLSQLCIDIGYKMYRKGIFSSYR